MEAPGAPLKTIPEEKAMVPDRQHHQPKRTTVLAIKPFTRVVNGVRRRTVLPAQLRCDFNNTFRREAPGQFNMGPELLHIAHGGDGLSDEEEEDEEEEAVDEGALSDDEEEAFPYPAGKSDIGEFLLHCQRFPLRRRA
jgi:hypothetical protein